jgi:hypothetical protein
MQGGIYRVDLLCRGPRRDHRPGRREGGKIGIDPQYVLLEHSTIDGRANGQDVKVAIGQEAIFIESGDSQILSNNVSLPPESDVAAVLLSLPSTLPQVSLSLAPVCAPRLEADFSSFVVTGAGGRPPAPEGWMPDLILAEDGQASDVRRRSAGH